MRDSLGGMSEGWVRQGYDKVARLGRKDTKRRHFPELEGHPVGQENGEETAETFRTVEERKRKQRVLKEFQIYR